MTRRRRKITDLCVVTLYSGPYLVGQQPSLRDVVSCSAVSASGVPRVCHTGDSACHTGDSACHTGDSACHTGDSAFPSLFVVAGDNIRAKVHSREWGKQTLLRALLSTAITPTDRQLNWACPTKFVAYRV